MKPMNNQITQNLYEFWKHIGALNNRLIETKNYLAVSMDKSDWPNRVFGLANDNEIIEEIQKLSIENKLPDIITLKKPNRLNNNSGYEFVFGQRNMALDLNLISNINSPNPNIKRVKTENDSIKFANTASKSFGYLVDPNVVFKIVKNSKIARLFTYQEDNDCLGCGIIFFDSNSNAGLHMIGTLPKGRDKGIGKSMTEKLLMEAKDNNAIYCVLHASLMGESIYKRLGFELYDEIETYKILKNKNN